MDGAGSVQFGYVRKKSSFGLDWVLEKYPIRSFAYL